ncbi:MAG: class I SAM-dependent methyltransferase [Sedimentisphaerales bacterium]
MMEYTRCNLCGKDNTELVFEVEEQITGDHKRLRIVKCKSCELVYVNPRPSKGEIIMYYPPETYCEHQPVGKKKLSRHVIMLILGSLPGYSRKTKVLNNIIGKCLGTVLLSQINIVVPFKENGRILDVGCGNGEMTSWMKEYGWDIHGVDIAKNACEIARKEGLKTFCGHLHEAQYPTEYFDAITINHVLEHTHNPLSLLRECNRILKGDGILIVAVPNFGCSDSRLFGKSWYCIDTPRHLYHFTSETLDAMFNVAGFQVNKRKTKLRVPFYHPSSIKSYRIANPGLLPLCNVLFKASAGRLIRYIFSKNRYSEFSMTLIAYASKYEHRG